MSENINENEFIHVEEEKLQQIKKQGTFMITPNLKWGIAIVCLAAFASGGSMYLAMHSQLIWEAMNYPYATAFVFAVPIAIFLIVLVFRFSEAIKSFFEIQLERVRKDTRSYWFEIAIICFIIVSMVEAGTFFNSIIQIPFFGYFAVLTLDLCAVQFMYARKSALLHSDEKKALRDMWGVFFTAALSAFANVYSSLMKFDLHSDKIPLWMSNSAPYIGFVFPALIVFLAWSLDSNISQKNIVDRYKDEQDIRIKLLEAQKESESKIISIQEELAALRQRDSFLRSIFFPKNKIRYITELVQGKVEKKLQEEIKVNLNAEINRILDARTMQPSSELSVIQSDLVSLRNMSVSQEELDKKIAEFELKIELFARAFNQWKQTLPQVIETKMQEVHNSDQFEIATERVFMRLIPSVTSDLQKHIETAQRYQIPEQTVSVNHVEEIEQEINKQNEQIQSEEIVEEAEEWKVSRVSQKDAKYKSAVGQCQIGRYTFARFDIAAETLKSKKITRQVLQDIYDQRLLPSGWFKIIEVRGWGGTTNDHVVMVIHPDEVGIQRVVLERMKLIKK